MLENAAEVIIDAGNSNFRVGTAYRVGPSTLLSAWHVVYGKNPSLPHDPEQILVRFPQSSVQTTHPVTVAWANPHQDVVLLQLDERAGLNPCNTLTIRASRVPEELEEPCVFVAFPVASRLPNENLAQAFRRYTWKPKARLAPGHFFNSGRLAIYITESMPVPRELLEGVCGAAVFHRNQIVGVLTEFPDSYDKIGLARPTYDLLSQAEFRRVFFRDAKTEFAEGALTVIYRTTEHIKGNPPEQVIQVLERLGVSSERLVRIRALIERDGLRREK